MDNGLSFGMPQYRTGISQIPIDPRQRLDDVMKAMKTMNMGATDCSLPVLYALEKNLEVDVFVIITDNETYFGKIHPYQALEMYRKKTGIPAKLAVMALTGTRKSIANPKDAGMIDMVGFDTKTPQILSEFANGFGRDQLAA